MESKAVFFFVTHMGDCDESLQELHGSAIFAPVEMKSWKFWDVQMQQHFAIILPWGFQDLDVFCERFH